jgi:hypothetical protein
VEAGGKGLILMEPTGRVPDAEVKLEERRILTRVMIRRPRH